MEGTRVGYANEVTAEFLHRFKAGDLVDVRERHGVWTGPHKLLGYKLDPPKKDAKPAAHLQIKLGEKKLERWLIVGDQQFIRKHIPEEQKQRIRARRMG